MNEEQIKHARKTLAQLEREEEMLAGYDRPGAVVILLPCAGNEHRYCKREWRRGDRTHVCRCSCHQKKGGAHAQHQQKI